MRKNTRLGLMIVTALTCTSIPSFAAPASEMTQVAQWVADEIGRMQDMTSQTQQYTTAASNLQQNIQAVQMAQQNLTPLSANDFANYNGYIDQLKNIMVATNAMSYQTADLDTKFTANFPGYDEHLNRGKTGDIKSQGVSYSQYNRSLTDSSRATALGTLRNLQASSNELRDDSLTMDMLKLQSHNAVGNKDVIQAANEIALHQTQTLKKLHMSMLNQTNLMTQSLAQQNERQAVSSAKTQTWHNSGLTRTKGNERSVKTWKE